MTVRINGQLAVIRDEDHLGIGNFREAYRHMPFATISIQHCNITDLDGMKSFYQDENLQVVNCPELTSLRGAPRDVKGYLRIVTCRELKSLDGCPRSIGGEFGLNNTSVSDWNDFPEEIGGNLTIFSSKPFPFRVFKNVKRFGGRIISCTGSLDGGILALFKAPMPNFAELTLNQKYHGGNYGKGPINLLSKLLVEANKDRSQVNKLMLEAQDMLIEHGLEELATL